MRTSESCLGSGEVGPGQWGPGWAQLALRVTMSWLAAGPVAPGAGEGAIPKAQQPPRRDPTLCLSPITAQAHGCGPRGSSPDLGLGPMLR